LGAVPARRKAGRYRRCLRDLAAQACADRQPGDRDEAGDGRDRGRALSRVHAQQARLPRALSLRTQL
jgi:hypothetical protein